MLPSIAHMFVGLICQQVGSLELHYFLFFKRIVTYLKSIPLWICCVVGEHLTYLSMSNSPLLKNVPEFPRCSSSLRPFVYLMSTVLGTPPVTAAPFGPNMSGHHSFPIGID